MSVQRDQHSIPSFCLVITQTDQNDEMAKCWPEFKNKVFKSII